MLDAKKMQGYLNILQEELVPATGCTEPVALAYAAARMTRLLGKQPEKIISKVSGNIIKNVKSVVVPNTGGLRGIESAIAAGVVAGDSEAKLQVISHVSHAQLGEIAQYVQNVPIKIECVETPRLLDIEIIGYAGARSAGVHIANNHSNIIEERVDGKVTFELPQNDNPEDNLTDKSILNVKDILEFANTVSIDELTSLVGPQAELNCAIAKEGFEGDWGANIGSVLKQTSDDSIWTKMKAWGAAGSDARMSGCEMPVVILSGSGNQGITASVPVVILGEHLGLPKEKILRAIALSDLVAIEQKRGIGRLSAYCGAVSAGVGVGAATAYLLDGSFEAIAHSIVNAVAIISGTICDGAKPSCAAKIAESIDAGILGWHMYEKHQQFRGGDGIVTKGVDETIANIGVLAKEGMAETDRTILGIMTNRC